MEVRERNSIMSKETLIVVDMQNDFVDGALGTAEAVATMKICQIDMVE